MNWLWKFDLETFRAINVGLHSSFLDPVFWALSYSGLGQVQFIVCALLWLRRDTRSWVAPLLSVIVVSGMLVAQLLKHLVERDRPSLLAFALKQEDWSYNSFPSGHSTTSFALAVMLCLLTYKTNRRWMGCAALVWAGSVGLSRIYRGMHWPTDVIAGALAGTFSACLVHLTFEWRQRLATSKTPMPLHRA